MSERLDPDVFERAAVAIERRGWFQGYYYEGDPAFGPVCAAGALAVACEGGPVPELLTRPYMRRLRRAVGTTVTHWNDDQVPDAGEVVATLRRVGAQVRAEQEFTAADVAEVYEREAALEGAQP